MKYLAVKNFEKYQHYKERRPPWVKLYNELLDDYAFSCLQDASKAHLLCIWLLASRHNNQLPHDAQWIGRAIQATSPVDLEALISAGFLTTSGDASETLADRKQSALPETETEEEAKKETTSRPRRVADEVPDGPPTSRSAPPKETWLSPYLGAYRTHYGANIAAPGQAAHYLRPSHEELGPAENLARWERYLAATPLDKVSTKRYAETHPAYALAPTAAALGARASPRTADDVQAERKLRVGKVDGRKSQRDGEEWWQQMRREAQEKGLTKAGELYDYAYQQLAS